MGGENRRASPSSSAWRNVYDRCAHVAAYSFGNSVGVTSHRYSYLTPDLGEVHPGAAYRELVPLGAVHLGEVYREAVHHEAHRDAVHPDAALRGADRPGRTHHGGVHLGQARRCDDHRGEDPGSDGTADFGWVQKTQRLHWVV